MHLKPIFSATKMHKFSAVIADTSNRTLEIKTCQEDRKILAVHLISVRFNIFLTLFVTFCNPKKLLHLNLFHCLLFFKEL